MTSPVVHLELHTPDLCRACAFYDELVEWRQERVLMSGASYQSLDLGTSLGGGVVECGTDRALWLPYVEVGSVAETTARAVALGASLTLSPREGRPDGGAS